MAGFRISSFIFLIFIYATVSAVVNIDPEKKERIDNFVNSLLFECEEHNNVVGMNLAVVYEGEVLYTTGYGVRNLGKSNGLGNWKHRKHISLYR